MLGHELRRPLTVIRGGATLLVDDADSLPPASRRQVLTMIDRSAGAMADLIDDMLTAVHLELGDVVYAMEALDVRTLVAEAVESARRAEPDRQIEVRGVEGLVVEADAQQAARALRAVVVNAAQHTPEGSAVEVVGSATGDSVRLAVLDRGSGIPAAQRERAFERFSRLGERGGAGLGLFLARGLARAMGGDVTVDGRENGGAAVCLTLKRRG